MASFYWQNVGKSVLKMKPILIGLLAILQNVSIFKLFKFQQVVLVLTVVSIAKAQHFAYGGPGVYGPAPIAKAPLAYAQPKAVAYAAPAFAKVAKGK